MGIRTRRAKKHSKTHFVGFSFAGVLGFIALLIIALSLSLGSVVSGWLSDLPDYQSPDSYLVAEPTTVYDANNNEIAAFYIQQRRSVDLDAISDYVKQGTVATEDRRFYQHNGVDPQSILRAVVSQILGGSEGASTITQQLVRNTVLSDEQFEYSLKRKVREAYIAIQIEKEYSKDQILNMYLNTIYYGHRAYGIEAASIVYFNKHANELTLAEAATLVGLPNSPSYLDPTVNPDACKTRRNLVLDRMLEADIISQDEHDAAQAEDLVLNEGTLVESESTYPHFVNYVRQLLLEDFSLDTIMQGGLQVYTTIDPKHQDAAQSAVDAVVAAGGNPNIDGALVSIDNSNGHILAMVGGADYNNPTWGEVNLAVQAKRQPGSSFKIFTVIAALEAGMNPNITLNCGSPMQILPNWLLQNYGNTDYGIRSLTSSIMVSANTGIVQVAQAIGGVDKVIDVAKRMGITSEISQYLPMVIGATSVSVLEMTSAYSTLARGGIKRDAVAITKIEDRNGNVVYEHEDTSERVLSAAVADDATQILEACTQPGGTSYTTTAHLTINQPFGAKTGSTTDGTNFYFAAFTPQVTVCTWLGDPRGNNTVYYQGSVPFTDTTTQRMFYLYCNEALAGLPRGSFPTSDEPRNYKADDTWYLPFTQKAEEEETDEDEESEDEQGDEETEAATKPTTPADPEEPRDSDTGEGDNAGGSGNDGDTAAGDGGETSGDA